jgi:hypothetical protein
VKAIDYSEIVSWCCMIFILNLNSLSIYSKTPEHQY